MDFSTAEATGEVHLRMHARLRLTRVIRHLPSTAGFLMALLLLSGPALRAGQNDPLQLRIDVQLATVDVYVDDAAGKPVTNLTRDDFVILDNGAIRDIQTFDSAETPYNVLLLFDRSSSTQDQWPFLVRAISRFIAQLPDQHRVALAAFDDKPEMLLGWKNARDFSRQAFTILSNNSGTNVYEALDWSLRELRGVKGRKGIIVFTDGVDNRLSRRLVSFQKDGTPTITPPELDSDFQKLLRMVTQSSVPIYFVAVNTDQNPDQQRVPNSFDLLQRSAARLRMEILATRSNGNLDLPHQIQDITALYEEIGWKLGHSYSLGFRPAQISSEGSYHHIVVTVRDESMHVTQSREGYYAQ